MDAIDYFSSKHPLRRIASQISLQARKKMFGRFMQHYHPDPDSTILDVGVTPDKALPESNFFEALYPYKSKITATSPEDASFLEQQYPGLKFIQTSGKQLPFPDKAFDFGFSFAVLEHVGSRDNQRSFVHELSRVSRTVFITTPNRFFPIEVHTFLPFLHWLPDPTYRRILRAAGMEFWSREENLNLLSERELISLFPPDMHVKIHYHRLLGIPSNLLAIAGLVG